MSELDIAVSIIILIPIVYIMCVIGMNDRATDWIHYHEDEIKGLLLKHGYSIYSKSCYDCAPCEIKFGIKEIGSEEEKMCVPSRKMKKLIRKLNHGKINCNDIMVYLNNKGEPVNPDKKPMR